MKLLQGAKLRKKDQQCHKGLGREKLLTGNLYLDGPI